MMASSSLPLSLLAKGIGQVVTNGHEKLEVYLEPEDYYNLKSYSPYHVPTLEHQDAILPEYDKRYTRPIPLHKTFVTRKGALLIFSEELANKAIAEEAWRLNLKHQHAGKHDEKNVDAHLWEEESTAASETVPSEKGPDSLRTVHDLSVAILTYGNRPDYRKKGDDLYLRFIHESRAPKQERKMRPGFSPKRYIAAWSKYWDDEMLQKLRTTGLVQDKTLFRQNPLLPHLYQPATYNMSAVPPPYRVTRNMLLAPGNIGTYEFQSYNTHHAQDSHAGAKEARPGQVLHAKRRRDPPPSHQDENEELMRNDREPIPIGSIQAVKFLESGEIQEVKYSELKPQEKQEILAELLATAWEHGKHIEETLELVLASNKPRAQSGASSSAASELMVDMHRAILSLVESPVRKQIQERQRLVQLEEEKKKKKHDEEEAKKERRRLRKQQKAEKEAAKLVKHAKMQEEQEQRAQEKNRRAEDKAKKLEEMKHAKEEELKEEERKKEERRRARREEKERKRQERHEARKKKEDEERKAHEEAEKKEEMRRQRQEEEAAEREERRRLRHEKREKRHQEKAMNEPSKPTEIILEEKEHKTHHEHQRHKEVLNIPGAELAAQDEAVDFVPAEERPRLQEEKQMYIGVEPPSQRGVLSSAPMPMVPNNTPATEQRKARIQRQIPMEAVIAEARSKDGYAASGSIASSQSSGKLVPLPPGTLVAAGDGKYARVTLAEPLPPQHAKPPKRKSLHVQPRTTLSPKPSLKSHSSGHSSGLRNNVFPGELPGDSESGSNRRSSFYGGAMPITSNIVKQTLSDKISMLSASQENSLAGSIKQASLVDQRPRYQEPLQEGGGPDYEDDQYDVPVIGVEPPTPMQHNVFSTPVAKGPSLQAIIPNENYLSPAPSESTRSKKSSKSSKKLSSVRYSEEVEDKLSAPSHTSSVKDSKPPEEEFSLSESKSSKSKSDTILSSEKSAPSRSKFLKVSDSAQLPGINVEVTYQSLKGSKGPGSQSSAASVSKTSVSKKSSSTHRGSVPSALIDKAQAAVCMPGGEVVSVGRRVEQLPTTDESTAEESSDESEKPTSPAPTSKKTSLKSGSVVSSEKLRSRRVSFKDDEKQESSSEVEDETETEGEADDALWPQAGDDKSGSRPISSRSEKLTDHAQKVAKLVVSNQRPGSRLEEDASEAAKLWNAVAAKEEGDEEEDEESESEEESEEEETVDEDDAFKAAAQEQEEKEKQEKEKAEKEKKEKLRKEAEEQKKASQKEIKPRVQAKKPPPSVKSFKSTSSVKSSISSVQEVFVNEVKRKASELGISETKLVFDADIVDKVSRSTIDPEEVEVFHDKEAGQHVVRSRHSSTTTSYQTSMSETESKKKQKLVIDMPLQEKTSASPRRSVSSVTTTTASPTSPSRLQALSRSSSVSGEKRKSSIPVDPAGVSLEYEVTSYEGKLGDPRPEEPVILTGRPKVEPEKLKTTVKAEKDADSGKKKPKGKADDVQTTKPEKEAGGKKGKKGRSGEGGETVMAISEDEKLKQDLARITDSQKSLGKKGGKKGKQKKQEKTQEPVALPAQPASPEKLPTKTPETPFLAGRPREKVIPEDQQSSPSSLSSKTTAKDSKKPSKPTTKQEPKTQVELEDKLTKPQKKSKKKGAELAKPKEESVQKEPTPSPEKDSPAPAETPKPAETETEDDDLEPLPPIPSATPEDDYAFVRVEETPEPTPPPEPVVEKQEDEKSQASEVTATEDGTEKTDGTEATDQKSAEDEADREAKLASKKEREAKRAAAADKRRLEVEKKRREKEEQIKKEKEEQERQEQLKEEFEAERRRRAEDMQRKREEAQKEKEREQQEEEMRRKREEQQKEREKRLQEEHKKKMEELQRKKKEEEEKKAELARIQAEEDERLRKEEEEVMAQMAEDERIEYERRKAEEAEQKRKEAEERRIREEEEARISMEQARIQALIKAKQQAALEEKLKFVREFFVEANGFDQTQNVNRAFSFSYFELLQLLGLEFTAENADL